MSAVQLRVEVTCKATLDELWVIEVDERLAADIEADPSLALDYIGGTDEARCVSQEDLRIYDEEDRMVTGVSR